MELNDKSELINKFDTFLFDCDGVIWKVVHTSFL